MKMYFCDGVISFSMHAFVYRSLYLGFIAENSGRSVNLSDLEDLLGGCPNLETLILMFDFSLFLPHKCAQLWSTASSKLCALELGYVYSATIEELLSSQLESQPSHKQPSVFPNLQKICLTVDYITDAMVGKLSKGLPSLTHLELRDAPLMEPIVTHDLSNFGIQQINLNGKLKHLSLIRSQEFFNSYFRRVNDLGLLLLADRCARIESISLGGFCRVTDTGFKTMLHSCSNLHKLRLSCGIQLTDLVFHDICATSLSLTHVSLRWCSLISNRAVTHLVANTSLTVLELRHCRNLGDEALRAIGSLRKLKILLLDGSDISDLGVSYLKERVVGSLASLSLRGCKRVTDKSISYLFDRSCKMNLQELDLSHLPNLSDNGILSFAKSRIPLLQLRMRNCPRIGNTSVVALASMQVNGNGWEGSSLRVLDLYNCGGIHFLSFSWLNKPYFPRLRWLGLCGSVNRNLVDALANSRPFLAIACEGEEMASDQWANADRLYMSTVDDAIEDDEDMVDNNRTRTDLHNIS
uniref:F-box/LRR-repeat protein 15-like leucin rich repeat domain-containing protein n=1 Tax=Kalanchoe fedtschenkoi TaxID=63787 RepID=A0A7N0U6B9_KALFE